jgi:hypothetical protein
VSHMVIFQAPGGSPGYNQFETLDEAVAFVESLRNEQNVTNARMFALEEIKFELKPYFKVELQALNAGEASPETFEEPPVEEAPAEEAPAEAAQAPVEPAPAPPPPQEEPAPAPPAEPAAAQTFGAFTDQEPAPAPAPAAPAPPAPQPEPEPAPEPAPEQPVRRGLFGR